MPNGIKIFLDTKSCSIQWLVIVIRFCNCVQGEYQSGRIVPAWSVSKMQCSKYSLSVYSNSFSAQNSHGHGVSPVRVAIVVVVVVVVDDSSQLGAPDC